MSELIVTIDGQQTKFTDIQHWYPLKAENCESIIADNVLQYFDFSKSLYILADWFSKLKIGGRLEVTIKDFREVAAKYIKGEKVNVLEAVYGKEQNYKSLFDKESLYRLMQAAGFEIEVASVTKGEENYISIIGRKFSEKERKSIITKKIVGLLSVPRLNFSSNRGVAERASYELGFPIYSYEGAFWGQTLTRAIELYYKNADYILTIDYDTWFVKQHIEKLYQLAEQNPQADAIIPIELKRREDVILASLGKVGTSQISLNEFKQPLISMVTGHFGLTLFKAKIFETLKKPWFWAQPNKDGEWNEGRLDDDIYFWHNFNQCGFKLFLATNVYVGHLELMACFAGMPENNFKPIYINSDKIETDLPPHCIPLI